MGGRKFNGARFDLVGVLRQHIVQPLHRLNRQQCAGWGDVKVQTQPHTRAGQHRHQHAAGKTDIGRYFTCKIGQTVFGIKHQNKGLIFNFDHLGVDLIAIWLCRQNHKQFCIRKAFIKSQACRVVIRCGFHRDKCLIQNRLCHNCSSIARRKAGTNSRSNHGFFLSQAVLRHDG